MGLQMKSEAVTLHEDNNGAIHQANTPKESARSKHLCIQVHVIRDVVKMGNIRIVQLAANLRHADVLIKNLGGDAFGRHRRYVMDSTVDD